MVSLRGVPSIRAWNTEVPTPATPRVPFDPSERLKAKNRYYVFLFSTEFARDDDAAVSSPRANSADNKKR